VTQEAFSASLVPWHDFFLASAGATGTRRSRCGAGGGRRDRPLPGVQGRRDPAPGRARLDPCLGLAHHDPADRLDHGSEPAAAFTAWRIWDTQGEGLVVGNLVIVVLVLLLGAADISWEMLTEVGTGGDEIG